MEGYLKKWTNIFTRWHLRYFILHDGILQYFEDKVGPIRGKIHMKICEINQTPEDPLRIIINSGTKNIQLKAKNVTDKIQWLNALRTAQLQTLKGVSSPNMNYFQQIDMQQQLQKDSGNLLEKQGNTKLKFSQVNQIFVRQSSMIGNDAHLKNLSVDDLSKVIENKINTVWDNSVLFDQKMIDIVKNVEPNSVIAGSVDEIEILSEHLIGSVTDCLKLIDEQRKKTTRMAKKLEKKLQKLETQYQSDNTNRQKKLNPETGQTVQQSLKKSINKAQDNTLFQSQQILDSNIGGGGRGNTQLKKQLDLQKQALEKQQIQQIQIKMLARKERFRTADSDQMQQLESQLQKHVKDQNDSLQGQDKKLILHGHAEMPSEQLASPLNIRRKFMGKLGLNIIKRTGNRSKTQFLTGISDFKSKMKSSQNKSFDDGNNNIESANNNFINVKNTGSDSHNKHYSSDTELKNILQIRQKNNNQVNNNKPISFLSDINEKKKDLHIQNTMQSNENFIDFTQKAHSHSNTSFQSFINPPEEEEAQSKHYETDDNKIVVGQSNLTRQDFDNTDGQLEQQQQQTIQGQEQQVQIIQEQAQQDLISKANQQKPLFKFQLNKAFDEIQQDDEQQQQLQQSQYQSKQMAERSQLSDHGLTDEENEKDQRKQYQDTLILMKQEHPEYYEILSEIMETDFIKFKVLTQNLVFKDLTFVQTQNQRQNIPVLLDIQQNIKQYWENIRGSLLLNIFQTNLPVQIYEPLSMLQRLAEQFEYSYLLEQANSVPLSEYDEQASASVSSSSSQNSCQRMAFVMAFIVSGFSTLHKRARFPFTPCLGETFQYSDINSNFRFFAEHVSVEPQISAYQAESVDFRVWENITLKYQFTGKQIQIAQPGICHVFLKASKEHFVISKPTVIVNNVMTGDVHIEVDGPLECFNLSTKDKGTLQFNKSSLKNSQIFNIQGEIHSRSATAQQTDANQHNNNNEDQSTLKYQLNGKWNKNLHGLEVATQKQKILWKKQPDIENCEENYNFSLFTINLNYLNKTLLTKILNTDSRLRGDIRALEYRKLALAAAEKERIFEKEQLRLDAMQNQDIKWHPRWFVLESNNINQFGQETAYVYRPECAQQQIALSDIQSEQDLF